MSDLPFMTSKTLLPKRWQYSDLAFFEHGYSPRANFAARFRFVASLLACCAGKRLRVSLAPHPCGFESLCDGPKKERPPLLGAYQIKWWAMRDVARGFAARFRSGPAALACCAGKRLRVSSAPHPVGFESHALGPKKKGSHCWEPIKSVVGDEGFEPPALCV